MLKVKINTNNTEKYFNSLPGRVRGRMINQSDSMAEIVKENTTPITPMRTGQLRRRFTKRPNFGSGDIKIRIWYRAINPRTGYDYAPVQETHQYKHYTTPGTGSRYLRRGIELSRQTIKDKQINIIKGAIRNGGL